MRDVSGASVPGATVVVRNEKTGEERTTVSAADGGYAARRRCKPSLYTIRVAAGEFAPLEYTGLQLLPAQEFTIDLELQPAGRDARA